MDWINTFINGLSLGGIYALIALGYTMVYGIAKMLNFAHGDIIMVGGYTIALTLDLLGRPLLAAVAAVLFCCLLGILVERVAYRPLRGASPLAVLITAIGVSYFLQSIAQILFGASPRFVQLFSGLGNVSLGKLTVSVSSLITLAITAVLMAALTVFVKFTKVGRAMIAVSEDAGEAKILGVNVNVIIALTFAIGSALAGVASVFYLMRYSSVSGTMGAMPGIKAFTAAVIGGIGSIPGAMIGGILLGVIECFSNATPIAPYTDAIEFAILIVLLLVRPTGILGKKRREKV